MRRRLLLAHLAEPVGHSYGAERKPADAEARVRLLTDEVGDRLGIVDLHWAQGEALTADERVRWQRERSALITAGRRGARGNDRLAGVFEAAAGVAELGYPGRVKVLVEDPIAMGSVAPDAVPQADRRA